MNKKLKRKRIPECNDVYREGLMKKVLDAAFGSLFMPQNRLE